MCTHFNKNKNNQQGQEQAISLLQAVRLTAMTPTNRVIATKPVAQRLVKKTLKPAANLQQQVPTGAACKAQ
jgi:hypothetical protein